MKTEYREASGLIFSGTGYITDVIVTADGADGEVVIYDGKNTNGEKLLKVNVKDGYTLPINLKTFPEFLVGLYVTINATTTSLTIGYRMKYTQKT